MIKITKSKENNSIHRLDASCRSRGGSFSLWPPPPLATALNAVEEDAYFCDNINFWNIFPAECKTLLLSRDIDNTHLKLQDGLD